MKKYFISLIFYNLHIEKLKNSYETTTFFIRCISHPDLHIKE